MQATEAVAAIESKATEMCALMGAEMWSVSAKTGENVLQLFSRIASLAFLSYIHSDMEQRKNSVSASIGNHSISESHIHEVAFEAQFY